MKKKYYIITAVVSYLLFLIATIPAKPVVSMINSDGLVLIKGVSGTIWEGKARLIDIDESTQFDDTTWSFSGWKLFTGKVAISLDSHFSENRISAELGSSFSGELFINELNAKIPAEEAAMMANIPLAQLSGLIFIDIEHAQWEQGELPLVTGTIHWKDATVTIAETASLGDVSIVLSESEQQLLHADIKNRGGDININGMAELVPEADYNVSIKLIPTATASNSIKQSLGLFAKQQSNGEYLLNNSGPLNQIGFL